MTTKQTNIIMCQLLGSSLEITSKRFKTSVKAIQALMSNERLQAEIQALRTRINETQKSATI